MRVHAGKSVPNSPMNKKTENLVGPNEITGLPIKQNGESINEADKD